MHISHFLRRAASLWPDKEAVVDGEHRFSYGQIFQRATQLSLVLLSRGVLAGQVVSIVAPNSHEFLEAYFACAMSGIILNPINYRLAAREVVAILRDAGSVAILVHGDFWQLIEDALSDTNLGENPLVISFGKSSKSENVPTSSTWLDYELELSHSSNSSNSSLNSFSGDCPAFDEIANLYYTSGTTGEAKGVMLSYENVSCHALCAIAELRLTDADTWLHAAPMFHLADAWATFAITAVGGKHVILPYFRAKDALAILAKEKVTISNLIPTMLNSMINDDEVKTWQYSSLRAILSGGSPIAPETVRRIIDTFGCEYVQTYGMTETSPYLTLSLPKSDMSNLSAEKLLQVRSRTGRPFMGVELKVVRTDGTDVAADDKEVGEIIARGPIVSPGYWKKPVETAAAFREGWLYTGDLAVIDSEGYLNIVDRKKDMIITGGENVYSTEVEYVLLEHPGVLECAVFGLPDPVWGESVTAAVVLRLGTVASGEELVQFVKQRIAHFKAPRKIEFLEELPKTGSGKIHKKSLRDRQLSVKS